MTARPVVLAMLLGLAVGPPVLAAQDFAVPAAPAAPSRPQARPAPRPAATAATTEAPDSSAAKAQQVIDSLNRKLATLQQKIPADSVSRRFYEGAVRRAWWFLAFWFVLVIAYLVWAIHRYAYNYGLSNREWKILYPEIYAAGKKVNEYQALRTRLIEHKLWLHQLQLADVGERIGGAPALPAVEPFEEPKQNPYQGDSFGLPPGTIRGILALTALVMFLLVEGVNLYSPVDLEDPFKGLVTALQMVLAFYFGSRAVQVLQARTQPAQRAEATTAPSASGVAGVAAGAGPVAAAPAPALPAAAGAEKELLPEDRSQDRLVNLIETSKSAAAPPGRIAEPVKLGEEHPLPLRVLALTAGFETGAGFPGCFGGLTGNFDGQVISFGALQWNIGQGSVQPLWREMRDRHPAELKQILGAAEYDDFSRMLDGTADDQKRWGLGIQYRSGRAWKIVEPWRTALQRLGVSEPMREIQLRTASDLYQVALGFCQAFGLTAERGVALMFDIRVQNGNPDKGGSGRLIREDFEQKVNPWWSDEEQQVERMRIIATRRAAVSRPMYVDDVLRRKMAIAEGSGRVHGRLWNLDADFAITMRPIA